MAKRVSRVVRFGPERVLLNWRSFMEALPYMNEEELIDSLRQETAKAKGEQRKDIIMRLKRRLGTLAAKRAKLEQKKELKELTA
jgi:hypothetical protein